MHNDTGVELKNPGVSGEVQDALTDVLRHGAHQLLTQAIETEVTEFLTRYRDARDEAGRRRIVRNGYLPPRTIQTGLGDVSVKAPRVRDRTGTIRFASSILPPYLRRTQTIEALLPWLYLKGISTGEFGEALTALLGPHAPGLSAGTISRLQAAWQHEHARWERRDLGSTPYVYLWVDGIHFGVRLEEANQCLLVVIGATAEGKKELLALTDGFRESEESWKDVLLDLKRRGLTVDPRLAIGDGALGFWKALPQVFGHTRTQRCWVHKTVNVLNKLPKHLQSKAKSALHQIWMASTREHAYRAFDAFLTAYAPKYPKAAECLAKDKKALLAFYDFPAEHWHHIRTTNPIESTFATVRLRTAKTRGCVSRTSLLSMVFKLAKSAEGRWLKLRGTELIAKLMQGVQFKNGVEVQKENRQEIAA
ncbi:MAG: IS256 family transposase [Nitrospirae bacterium]|nr:IS256 family transposase [Nitrospirota bacterium]